MSMPTGTVKWFNNAKGYGFILPEGGGDDLFVHYSSIDMDGYKTLKAGQAVEYDTHEGDKGRHATNVRSCGTAAEPDTSREERSARPRGQAGNGNGRSRGNGRSDPLADRAYGGHALHGDSIAAAMLSAAGDD
jgi:CspA family cold shock protein